MFKTHPRFLEEIWHSGGFNAPKHPSFRVKVMEDGHWSEVSTPSSSSLRRVFAQSHSRLHGKEHQLGSRVATITWLRPSLSPLGFGDVYSFSV